MNHTASSPVASSTQPTSAFAVHITEELHHYDEHLHDVRGLAEGTRSHRELCASSCANMLIR